MAGKKQDQISGFQTLKALFAYTKPYRWMLYTATVLAVLLAPISAVTPYLVNLIVDDHIMKSDPQGMMVLSLWFLALLILTTGLRYYFMILTNLLGQSVIKDLRTKVYSHLLTQNCSYFDNTPVGTNTTRTISDLESLNSVFSEGLITIIADILAIICILGLMFYSSVKLTLICLVSFPLLIVASYIFKEKVKASFQRVRNEITRMNTFLQEHISGMKIVQIFNAEKHVSNEFKTINREYTQANLDGIFYYAVFFPVVEIIAAASLGFMVWWGAQGVIHHEVTLGHLVAFPMFLSRLFQPIRMLADKFNTLQMGLLAGSRVLQVLDLKQTEEDLGINSNASLRGDIKYDRISFSYKTDIPVLADISFTLPAGKALAIIGPTGSGKSSIIQLLNRLYKINSGQIYIGDTEIRDFTLDHLRSKIAFVQQDVFLFSGSLLENIRLNRKEISLEKVTQCVQQLGLEEFIHSLPNGLAYELTERGSNLSLGQRQLVSFIRALVGDPEILVLDEATASIDPHSEKLIQSALEKLICGRTSITIAHRLSTIQHADFLLEIEEGKIKEFGPMKELLSHSDRYFNIKHYQPS